MATELTGAALDRRSFSIGSLEFREAEGPGLGRIEGIAVPYDRWTKIGSWFEERIERGAFTEYLRGGGDVVYNYHHDRSAIMGRRSSGTLTVEERPEGVWVSLDIPDTTLGRDMREMVRRGDVTGHSIEFRTLSDHWEYADEEAGVPMDRRTVTKAELPGVALTWDPAYTDTTAALRSREEAKKADLRDEADAVIDGIVPDDERRARRLREAQARARIAGLAGGTDAAGEDDAA